MVERNEKSQQICIISILWEKKMFILV